MSTRLSTLRARLTDAQKQLADLLESCFGREPLLPGSLYLSRRKCGKANCRCAGGELHEGLALSLRGEGRPRNFSPPPDQIDALRKMTDDYRRLRRARARLARWHGEVMKLVDEIQAVRVQLGEAELKKLQKRRASTGPAAPSTRS
jgi:hypothetical protein